MAQETILVVEDEAYVQGMLEDFLTRAGYRVVVVPTAEEASSELKKGGIDLVLLDKNLPDMSGVELLSQLRFEDPKLPVIFMTGYPSERSKLLVHHLGISAYFEKPVNLKLLSEAIREALRASETGQQGPDQQLRLVPAVAASEMERPIDLVVVSASDGLKGLLEQMQVQNMKLCVLCATVDEVYDVLLHHEAHVLALDLSLVGAGSLAIVRWATERHPAISVVALATGPTPDPRVRDLLADLNVRYVLDPSDLDPGSLAMRLEILLRRSKTLHALRAT